MSPPRLRVLTVTARYLPESGGVEEHVRQVATRLAARGVRMTVLTTDASGELPRRERTAGFDVERIRAWNLGSDVRFAPAVYGRVARGGWDVVHVQSYHTLVAPLGLLAAARAHIPYVLTFHAGGHSSRLRHRARPLQRRLLRPLLARAVRLVALTRAEVDGYVRELGIDERRFVVIPNGIDMPAVGPVRREDVSGPLIASIGRLERYKGHQRILRALPQILERRPAARLWIAGSGTFEPELRRLAGLLGVSERVEIRAVAGGDREAMARRIAASDVVVLLSEFETHPIAVLEALSLGRPVVVADAPGLRELGDAGLARTVPLHAPPAAVAEAVVGQLEHPVRPRSMSLPTWDDCADALLELYTQAALRR